MAISFVAKSAFASGTAGLTVGAVSGVASGDLILLFVESANQAITTPSGYTVVPGAQVSAGTADAAGGMLLNVFYQWATGADTSTTVADSGNHTTAIKLAYRGVDSTTPFDATPVTGTKTTASTSSTYPGITTATAAALVIYASALDLDAASTATTSAQSNGNLTSLTERHDQTVTSGAGGGIVVTDGFKATAGASGNMTATVTSTQQVYITLALRPQGAVTHTSTGALVGQGSTITGSATKLAPGGNVLQSAYSVDDSGSNGTTLSATLNGVTAGSALVAFVGCSDSVTSISVSDGTAYSAAADGRASNTTDSQTSQVFYLPNAGSGNHTITATFSPTIAWRRLRVFEIAGIATSAPEDGAAHQVQNGVGTTADSISSTATGATSNANDFVLGLTQDTVWTDPGSGTMAAGTGFTLIGSNQILAAEYKNVTATGAQTATFTDTKNSNRTAHVLALKTLSSGPVTHATSGDLVGSESAVAGTAAHIALHGTTGALTGSGAAVTGSANRFRAHASTGTLAAQGSAVVGSAARSTGAVTHSTSGALVGQGAAVAGTSNRFRAHASTGTLAGQGAAVAGAAQHNQPHATTGALTGQGAAVSGAANRFRAHASTAALVGQGATVSGAASHKLLHTSTGALVGSGSAVAGSANRFKAHDSSGALVGSGSTVAGSASRSTGAVTHTATGDLVGSDSTVAGAANRFRSHDATGALGGSGAALVGATARTRAHASSGTLAGQGAAVIGSAGRAGAPVAHAASGSLAGQGAEVAGSAARTRVHLAAGVLGGQSAIVVGSADLVNLGVSVALLPGGYQPLRAAEGSRPPQIGGQRLAEHFGTRPAFNASRRPSNTTSSRRLH